ncbi:heavy-metal-associated domain-containing protein [Paraburkholderia sediminicola]|uniref:Heavy-metal-associated domain-containing protein n=1 Tax=Paraburkholderia rhynchosiae TaxID=487049 RepID=A0ACC7NJ24_9BURK
MEFEVKDMTCGHCAGLITKAVKDADQSAMVHVYLDQKRVKVVSETSPDEFLHAISEAGYSPILKD